MAGRRKQASVRHPSRRESDPSTGGALRSESERHEPHELPGESDPHGLLALSDPLFRSTDGSEILRMAMAHVGALGPYRLEAGYLVTGDGIVRVSRVSARESEGGEAVDRQVRELAEADGPVAFPKQLWGWAFGLRGFGRLLGYLVVSSRLRPGEQDQLLITRLMRLTAAALSLAAAQHREHDNARELDRLRGERATTSQQLDSLRSELHQQRIVHETLADVAAQGGGEDAITHALHDLTGLPVVAEDRFGNLRSWAGPGRPDSYPAPPAERQQEMLRQAAIGPGPVRVKDRLIALARPRGEVLGLLAVVDPDGTADARTLFALEHAVRSLALELTHLHNLAEAELRLRRQLVDDLLEGTDEASAYARSEAVGHDLHQAHHVIVVNWPGRAADDAFTQAVERAAAAVGVRALATRRGGRVVLLTEVKPNGDALHAALARELGTRAGAIGVSRRCESPASIPPGYQEALRALEVRRQSRERDGATFFDDLGLYRILGPGSDRRELEVFVREWLGRLIDYDTEHGTQLVETLSQYFDCGGNYDETATALTVHRSTLRYRLQRIREIGDRDLADVDTRLSLQVATRVWKIMLGGRG
ncbi:PucR family transcriptional regulator [Streptomyces sp. NPDC019531]|uniref:PucR family transcriptional regulator n=1 Tax=Streptomyces sp. NPDC019531 TaxID=3365062 RepID=UPI003850B65F